MQKLYMTINIWCALSGMYYHNDSDARYSKSMFGGNDWASNRDSKTAPNQ